MTIISTWATDVIVGARRVGDVTDAQGVMHHNVPFLVMREATEAEYAAQDMSYFTPQPGLRYYEISMD